MKKTNYLVISFALIVFLVWIFSIDELSVADKYVGINKEIFDAEQMSMPENQFSIEIHENNSLCFLDMEKGNEGIRKFFGYNLPLTFWLDFTKTGNDCISYHSSDKGSYYLLKGFLICPECIETSVIGEKTDGHFETVSGRGYRIVGREAYNNDQRERVILLGDDEKSYMINNIPAFQIDTYTNAAYYVIASEDGTNHHEKYDVTLRVEGDTEFTDGQTRGHTFEEFIKNSDFENAEEYIGFDIHFSNDGEIDGLTRSSNQFTDY